MKPYSNDIPNFWANWADQPNKFWYNWGIFGKTKSPHFSTEFLVHYVFQSFNCFFTKNFFFRPNPTISQIMILVENNIGNSHHASVVGAL